MITEPVIGLASYWFSMPLPYFDVIVASVIGLSTLFYVARIAGISILYALGHKHLTQDERLELAKAEHQHAGPSLVG
jgi:hypothetical protein